MFSVKDDMATKKSFREEFTFDERKAEADNIRTKFPDRIPTIVEKHEQVGDSLPDLDKRKFLAPGDLTMGQFIYVIRKRMKLEPEKALFFFINDTLAPSSRTMGQLYQEHKADDGFMYITLSAENTFGQRGCTGTGSL